MSLRRSAAAAGSLLALGALAFAGPAHAGTTVFQEDFSGATPGANKTGVIGGTQFQVTANTVDVVGVLNGSFANSVANPTGNALDLVGSPGAGAIASTSAIPLVAGDSYTVSFQYILQGFATGTTPSVDFQVGLGSFSTLLTAIPEVQTAAIDVTPSINDPLATLTFATVTEVPGDAFHGAVLSNITVTDNGAVAAPEPSSFVLASAGGILALLGCRRRKRPAHAVS